MNTFKKIVSIVDGNGLRFNVKLEITGRNGYPEFTASATYSGGGGQCLDSIVPRTEGQKKLIETWEKWHLNGRDNPLYPSLDTDLLDLVQTLELEEQQRAQKKEEELKNASEDERLLARMEEHDLDADLIDAVKSYFHLFGDDSDLMDFAERYRGKWASDEAFSQDYAEELGLVDQEATWPHNCIDWEKAFYQLMDDFVEHNGYYFSKY